MNAQRQAVVGDRVYWLGDHVHPPRDGTVAEIIPSGAQAGLLAIEWDARHSERLGCFFIGAGCRTPAIPRRIIHPALLHSPRWGWTDERDEAVASAMDRKAQLMAGAA